MIFKTLLPIFYLSTQNIF